MADATVVNKFPKLTNTKQDILNLQKQFKDDGATSCDLSEDADNYILTTVWPGDC